MENAEPKPGYTRNSIIIHWVTAALVVALFLTHEGARGTASYAFHVGFGAIAGLFLLWRIVRRITRGSPPKTPQHPALNLLAELVKWALLLTIAGLVITGYLLPWSMGQPLDIMGPISIPSPLPRDRAFHELLEVSHDFLGHIIVPLAALHILGAIKHAVVNGDGVLSRMTDPVEDGR
ncbi:MAG: cytochrome b/b6 domain-containing protein [Pseudomonadota bacterium]